MDDKLLIKKLQALLHDPPEKPIILGRIGHEGRAKDLMAEIMGKGDAKIPEEVRTADRIASAADRINLPKDERFIADFQKNPVIIHPLSGRLVDLKSLSEVDIGGITSSVDRAVVYLADKYKGDTEKLYLALWRELADYLIKEGAKLGQLWELLPADTRIPDHSIWEHKRITSAIAGALPKTAFLLFAIGPVQDFIATARKTQDLWAGSYLLSYLSWSAMKVVVEEFGPDSIIFPDLCRQPIVDLWLKDKGLQIDGHIGSEALSSPTLPNRFLAIVSEGSVAEVAYRAKKAVKETFQSVCNAVKDRMAEKLGISSGEWETIWQRQTKDFIETYWAATPVEDHRDFIREYKQLMGVANKWDFDDLLTAYEKGFAPNVGTIYGQIYKFTEKALGSRKTVRDFSRQSEPNHKCTLCGVREPVHPGSHNGQDCREEFGALKGFWQDAVIPAFPQIRKSERLCGVCATKRFAASHYFNSKLKLGISNAMPSVSMIATASFKEKIICNLGTPELHTRVNELVNYLNILFAGNEDRLKGEPLPMVRRMCRNEAIIDPELADQFSRIEGDWLYEDSFREMLTAVQDNLKS